MELDKLLEVKAVKSKRKRAKKIKSPLGPYETTGTTFDAGTRAIEIESITPDAIRYRLKGKPDIYTLPHGVAFQRAVSIATGTSTAPREGRITRNLI